MTEVPIEIRCQEDAYVGEVAMAVNDGWRGIAMARLHR